MFRLDLTLSTIKNLLNDLPRKSYYYVAYNLYPCALVFKTVFRVLCIMHLF